MAEKHCSVDGCVKPQNSRSYCGTHYQRWRKTGTPHRLCEGCGKQLPMERGLRKFCNDDCKPRCKADECSRAARSRDGYCARHKALVRNNGVPVGKHEWTPLSHTYECEVCGGSFQRGHGSRKFCSANCQALDSRYGGDVPPLDFDCAMCGETVTRSWGKVHQRRDKKLCDKCRRSKEKRHKSSPGYLAKRDGDTCGICGNTVDLSLTYPDLMRGSVDHILPVALGGPHDESNLQLSHLQCNLKKQARIDFKIS